jgi:hypothetical protein
MASIKLDPDEISNPVYFWKRAGIDPDSVIISHGKRVRATLATKKPKAHELRPRQCRFKVAGQFNPAHVADK